MPSPSIQTKKHAGRKPPGPSQKVLKPTRLCHDDPEHPDHSPVLPRLSKAQGQLAGIERMIQERRYCVDILVQFRAVLSAVRAAEVSIFENHLIHCVRQALQSRDEEMIEIKIRELSDLLERRSVI